MSFKKISPIYMNKYNFVDTNINKKDKGKRALDVGCGYGEYIQLLSKKGLNVKGIDVDKKAIRGQENVIYSHAEKIPFKNENFDIITCIDVLEHVDDYEKSIKEIRRILKKGGKLILTVPNIQFPITYDPINFILKFFNNKLNIGMWHWGHKRLFDVTSIIKSLKKNNFRVIHYEQRSHIFVCFFVNYLPYIIDKFIMKSRYNNKKKKNGGVINFIGHIYAILNKMDSIIFKKFKGVSICVIAMKEK